MSSSTPGLASLYVHFPFCETKCHYCDFYSLGRERTKVTDADQFETALTQECKLSAPMLAERMDTIFLGGGTPSMTPPESMARALTPLELHRRVDAQTEWTMEVNPSSVSAANLTAYRRLGVNRISMGVQALRDDLLLKLGRVHSRDAALKALETLFSVGFDNVSVDLLCGVPGQSIEDLREALERLTAFPITHLSCYLLTLTKTHKMYRDLPDEDTQLAHLLLIDEWMQAKGFEHYEISNYAQPGKRARHNLHYWQGGSYLGLGPSAHSFDAVAGTRWKNVSSLHKYAELLGQNKTPVEWTEKLTDEQKRLESWMLALRLDEGIPESWLTTEGQRAKARQLTLTQILETHPSIPGRLRLTARGMAVSDQVIGLLA